MSSSFSPLLEYKDNTVVNIVVKRNLSVKSSPHWNSPLTQTRYSILTAYLLNVSAAAHQLLVLMALVTELSCRLSNENCLMKRRKLKTRF